MMAFRIRCINQRIRACRSVGDFLQTPGITHTHRRVQSATTVTIARLDHRVSVKHLEKICHQTANPKDPSTINKRDYIGNVRNSIHPEASFRHDLFIRNKAKKVDHKKFMPQKEVCDAHCSSYVNNVLSNFEPQMGLQSHWMNICISNAVPQETNILLSSQGGTGGTPSNSDFEKDRAKREEYLITMKDFLEKSLPPIFEVGISFNAYTPNIVLENSYHGKKKVVLGLQNYKIEVFKLRAITAINFIHTRMCVLSTSCDLDENCVRVRWRILGLKQITALRRLHVYGKFWKVSKIPDRELEKDAVWYDGISYYYLNDEGLVNRHVITRVEEDSSRTISTDMSVKERLARNLGVLSSKQV